MQVSARLDKLAPSIEGLGQHAFRAVAYALEVIPKTLAQNCGGDVVRTITELRAKHNKEDGLYWGIEGISG